MILKQAKKINMETPLCQNVVDGNQLFKKKFFQNNSEIFSDVWRQTIAAKNIPYKIILKQCIVKI